MKRKNSFKKIPSSLYQKIVDSVPICCVDIVLKSGKNIFLFKRSYEPAKGEWWLIGGRILKGERIENAVKRKVMEEVGIEINIVKKIGVYESFFDKNRFSTNKKKSSTHSIAVCYLVKPKNPNFIVTMNEEFLDFKKITKSFNGMHSYVKKILRGAKLI